MLYRGRGPKRPKIDRQKGALDRLEVSLKKAKDDSDKKRMNKEIDILKEIIRGR
jgi:hypothetical protein